MLLVKSKGGGGLRRSIATANHSDDFLDEIEAPMWADLTLEAHLMDQDIDDAWFRTPHPVHQMSSRRLKSCFPYCMEEDLPSPKLLIRSPALPDSVSRSRGKHYGNRKWVGSEHISTDKMQPIRKLGRKIEGQDSGGSSSSSTITTSSSTKKTLTSSGDLKHSSSLKSSSTMDTSVVKPKLSLGGPKSTYIANASNLGGRSKTKYSFRGDNEGQNFLRDRRSTSNKSTIGSSYSPVCKIESICSSVMLKNGTRMEDKKGSRLVSILKDPERQILDSSKHQRKAADTKRSCREPKLKGLCSSLSMKPMHSLNEVVPVNVRTVINMTQPRQSATTGKLKSRVVSDKMDVSERKIRNQVEIDCLNPWDKVLKEKRRQIVSFSEAIYDRSPRCACK